MVDLDELDRLHAALPELCGRAEVDAWSPTVFAVVAEGPLSANRRSDVSPSMGEVAVAAVILLNAYPALAAEVRALREVADAAEAYRACREGMQTQGGQNALDRRDTAARLAAALARVPR